jgi:hypothetical protein
MRGGQPDDVLCLLLPDNESLLDPPIPVSWLDLDGTVACIITLAGIEPCPP